MKKLIRVTADDIASGTRNRTDCCPVALALTRALGQPCEINYDSWGLAKEHRRGTIPARVLEFIEDFDQKEEVKPFTFTVTL